VIYLIHHDATGAMGLILNRPVAEAPCLNCWNRPGWKARG
jgi:putative AlgH/UPF0301 family transcriptional regulator